MTQRKDSLREVVEGIDLDDLIKFVNSTLVSQYKDLEPIAVINQNEIKDIKDVIYRSLSIFAGEESYNSFEKKIAFIFYSIVKGHFLNNGNKRTGAGRHRVENDRL
jgi:prophage maintenance system killer protein